MTGAEAPVQVMVVAPVVASDDKMPMVAPDPFLRVRPPPVSNAEKDPLMEKQVVAPFFTVDVMFKEASIALMTFTPLE
jgi:hypothetical protein